MLIDFPSEGSSQLPWQLGRNRKSGGGGRLLRLNFKIVRIVFVLFMSSVIKNIYNNVNFSLKRLGRTTPKTPLYLRLWQVRHTINCQYFHIEEARKARILLDINHC